MALTERLALIITGNATHAVHELDTLGARLTGVDGLARKTAASGGLVGKAYTGAALLGAVALVEMIKKGSEALVEQQRIDAQTKSVLASTGAVAGVTAAQVGLLGHELAHYSAYTIEAVKQTENLLLTFTAIKNQSGEGNDVFTQTTKAVLDMSTALGEDLKDASIQVGKALNNPIVGLTALRRVGVSFDEQQVATIKHLTETGHLLDAQKLILGELNKEFGNSAEAAGKTAAGGFAQLKDSVTELDKVIAGPVLQPLTGALHNMASVVREINAHPLASKAFGDLAGVALAAFLASKSIKALKAIRDSELASTVRSTPARTLETESLVAEAEAAARTAAALEGLSAAETASAVAAARAAAVRAGATGAGAGAGAARAGVLSRFLGPVALGVTAGEVGSHLLFGKGVESIPGEVKAHSQGEHLNDAISAYQQGGYNYGQRRALEGLNTEVISARTKAAKGDYSELNKAVDDVNKAIDANVHINDAAAYATNQHTAALRVNAAAAADNLKAWLDGADERQKALAQEASSFDSSLASQYFTTGAIGGKLLAKSAKASEASDSASHTAKSANEAVARDERKLADLRKTGKATANQLATAEDNLARAKERAANAGARASSAQEKANAAAAKTKGLTVKDLLGEKRTGLAYSQGLAKDAGKLVKSGLSPEVLKGLEDTEKQFPGTIHNLVGHLSKALVAELNADQVKTQKAQEAFLGMDEAATSRLLVLAKKQANAVFDAYMATLASRQADADRINASRDVVPPAGTPTVPTPAPTPPPGPYNPSGSPLLGAPYPTAPKPGTSITFNNATINAGTVSQLSQAAINAARLKQLGPV